MILTEHFNRGTERERRKALRRNATAAERLLWQHLKGKRLGVKFRRQYSVDVYILDFYAPRAKLAVEVDGDSHCRAAAVVYDAERTAHLKRFGIEVLRFTNLEVIENLEGVLHAVEGAVKHRATTSP